MVKKRIDIRSELRAGDRPQGSRLTKGDIGCILSIGEGAGLVRSFDVGKRVWHREWGLVMQNDEQRNRDINASTAKE